jgi:hypothetical protein
MFFDDVSDVLDHLATYVEPIYLVGDANVRLDRPTEANTIQFNNVLTAHGLVNRVTAVTHDKGGALDIVAVRESMMSRVDVVDADLSDHRLLTWTAPFARPRPIYSTITSRPWSRLKVSVLRAALVASPVCCSESWSGLSVDEMAQLYNTELTTIVDRLVPVRTSRYRRRPSDPWFDDDCRVAKRCVRLFEREARRASRRASDTAAAAAIAKWRERRRAYRGLLKQKREEFWKTKVTAERSAPRRLWRSIDVLLGRGSSPSSAAISAGDAHQFFDDKVAGVRASTSDAPPPTFSAAPANSRLHVFRPLTIDDVIAAVRLLPDKQCASDPLPTRLLKDNIDLLGPFLVELFNRSFESGTVPEVFKSAYITPLLKKPDMDSAEAKSYRPISNLSVISKLLERLVARQLLDYLVTAGLLPDLQSAYRAHHSTETAVLKVLSDIFIYLFYYENRTYKYIVVQQNKHKMYRKKEQSVQTNMCVK